MINSPQNYLLRKMKCRLVYTQGYHRSRTKNKDGWGKFYFITQKENNHIVCNQPKQKETIASACTTNVR